MTYLTTALLLACFYFHPKVKFPPKSEPRMSRKQKRGLEVPQNGWRILISIVQGQGKWSLPLFSSSLANKICLFLYWSVFHIVLLKSCERLESQGGWSAAAWLFWKVFSLKKSRCVTVLYGKKSRWWTLHITHAPPACGHVEHIYCCTTLLRLIFTLLLACHARWTPVFGPVLIIVVLPRVNSCVLDVPDLLALGDV